MTATSAPDVSGTWLLTLDTPMGEQSTTVLLVDEGGTLGGTMTGPNGEVALTDIQSTGNTLRWKAKVTKPMSMTMNFDLTVDGDSLSGSFKPGLFPKGKVRGQRP